MPSAFAHGLVGVTLASALPRASRPIGFVVALALLAAAPDLDVLGFSLGVPYAHPLGHRGVTHSIAFAALVGASDEVPKNKPGWMPLDLTPTLLHAEPSPRTEWYYNQYGFRSGNYKLHLGTQHPTDPIARKRRSATIHEHPLLFDLKADIGEQNNIAAEHPEIVKQLRDRIARIQQ